MPRDFEISDTTKESEWVQDPYPWTNYWRCGNCKDTHRIEHSTKLTEYCSRCGFRMRNPQFIPVYYDYD